MAASNELDAKRDRLLATLRAYESVAVAFSGGVDSAVVAKAARLALGDSAVAVTAVSPSLASGELEAARELARLIGIAHRVIQTSEFEEPRYLANAANRCYFCKTELYTRLEQLLPELGVRVIANGANSDDTGDWRPGMRAADEHRVRSPLIEAGLNKADVRAIARHWSLPAWDKPATPCLSSRIAYGLAVTSERVRQVDAAEQFLRGHGFRELRVRYPQPGVARIEVPLAEIGRFMDPELRRAVVDHLKALGFSSITLDLEGFRSGSMNALLSPERLTLLEPDAPPRGAADDRA
jgi:uncharacterized protein